MPEEFEITDEKRGEYIAKLVEFIRRQYFQDLVQASNKGVPLDIDFQVLEKFNPEIAVVLLNYPDSFFEICLDVMKQIELPKEETEKEEEPTKVRVHNLPEVINIRDLRAAHIGKFTSTEGIVRKASEIRPEITETIWQCLECGDIIYQPRKGTFVSKPFQCDCGSKGFKQIGKKLVDTRWIVIEEPFELTEGEKPSQLTILLTSDLVTSQHRNQTDPGNRLRFTGVLKDIPKGKSYSVKLDFFLHANHFKPTEIGYEKIEVSEEDVKEIKKLSKDPKIYETFVDSLAPSLYGLRDEKEAIIMQLFGGVPRKLKDNTKIRGNIHVLLIGDPASGKSQLLKLVPTIVPRGRYVSGKGVTSAGLTASVTKDELFMGGWVLEAGAMVLAHKGLLSIDEFEKMNPDDMVAMHEALEQGCYDYNTEIILGDGEITKIGEFVEKFIPEKKGQKIMKNISEKKIDIISTDLKNIMKARITAVGKHRERETLNIILSDGKELIITPKHPVFTIIDNKIGLIEARQLKKNAMIPVINQIALTRFIESGRKRRIITSKHPFRVNTTKNIIKWIKIRNIKKIRKNQWVFDVTVNPTRTFIGNGVICHNSVSIAKASIVTTLPAETSVLAGGNPKWSRFDSYKSISEQIIIPETLLGRFDLKFALRDIPDAKRDRMIVDHVLKGRDEDFTEIQPKLDPKFVRKYIAYCKQHIKPRMSKDVGNMLKEFYIKTRKKAEGGNAPIPITLRQFESMIRISEASAKIQLSDVIRKQDAQRAIRLMRVSLKQLGFDPDTGQIDIDKAEGATTFSERSKLRVIMDIINEMSLKKKDISLKDLEAEARKEGIEDIYETVERLKREGTLFEPNPGFVQKV